MKYPKFTVITFTLNFQTNHFTKQVSTLTITAMLIVTSAAEDTFIKRQHNIRTLTRDTHVNLN
jgi:hypothetical protein